MAVTGKEFSGIFSSRKTLVLGRDRKATQISGRDAFVTDDDISDPNDKVAVAKTLTGQADKSNQHLYGYYCGAVSAAACFSAKAYVSRGEYNVISKRRLVSALVASTLLSVPAYSATVTIDFNFASQGQSMFAPGEEPLAVFDKTLVNQGIPTTTVGNKSSQRNPAWTVWNNNRPSVRSCTPTYIGCNLARGTEIAARKSYDLLVPQPTKTFNNIGASLTLDYGLSLGYSGRVGFGDGVVDTSYNGSATTSVSDIQADGTIALITTKTGGTASLESDFPDLVLDLDLDTSLSALMQINGRYIGSSGSVQDETIKIIDYSETKKTEIISGTLSEDGLTFGTLDQPDISLDVSSVGPKTFYTGPNGTILGVSAGAGIPVASISAKYPEMDIAVAGLVFDEGLTGTIEPIERTTVDALNLAFDNDPPANSDVARFELDIDGLLSTPLGFGAQISTPAGTLLRAEANIVDLDQASYFSLGQTLKFDPNMKVRYEFSEAVQYILPNGDTSTEFVNSLTIGLNEELRIVHPKTPNFSVVPVYTLEDAQLFNEIAGYMDFTLETDWFQLILDGQAASAIGAQVNASLLSSSLGLNANPIELFTTGSKTEGFFLGGFDDVFGEKLSIGYGGDVAPVPLPAAGWMLIGGLTGLGALRRFKRRQPSSK